MTVFIVNFVSLAFLKNVVLIQEPFGTQLKKFGIVEASLSYNREDLKLFVFAAEKKTVTNLQRQSL